MGTSMLIQNFPACGKLGLCKTISKVGFIHGNLVFHYSVKMTFVSLSWGTGQLLEEQTDSWGEGLPPPAGLNGVPE